MSRENQLRTDVIRGLTNYDWSRHAETPFNITSEHARKIHFVDEGARDGAHGVGIYPTAKEMMQYIHASYELGMRNITMGIFPGIVDNDMDRTMCEVLEKMHKEMPDATPIVLSLATANSLKWTDKCVKINPNLKAIVFQGTASIRLFVEGWTEDEVIANMDRFIRDTVAQGVQVIGGSEHTTQTRPEFLQRMIETQINAGANEFCIADTIGISDPAGAFNIVRFTREVLNAMGRKDVPIHWHGHNDTGNGVANAYAAILAGATHLHVTPYGIGERAGNLEMEVMIWNLHKIFEAEGIETPWKIKNLMYVLKTYCKITKVEVPRFGAFGANSTETYLGIHAAGIDKADDLYREALTQGDVELIKLLDEIRNTVYSGVNHSKVGGELVVRVGHSSGKANVLAVAKRLALPVPNDEKIQKCLDTARRLRKVLTDLEVINLLTSEI